MISLATNTIDSAIIASTGGPGTCTSPSVAATSVTLCASVNAVTIAAVERTAESVKTRLSLAG